MVQYYRPWSLSRKIWTFNFIGIFILIPFLIAIGEYALWTKRQRIAETAKARAMVEDELRELKGVLESKKISTLVVQPLEYENVPIPFGEFLTELAGVPVLNDERIRCINLVLPDLFYHLFTQTGIDIKVTQEASGENFAELHTFLSHFGQLNAFLKLKVIDPNSEELIWSGIVPAKTISRR